MVKQHQGNKLFSEPQLALNMVLLQFTILIYLSIYGLAERKKKKKKAKLYHIFVKWRGPS